MKIFSTKNCRREKGDAVVFLIVFICFLFVFHFAVKSFFGYTVKNVVAVNSENFVSEVLEEYEAVIVMFYSGKHSTDYRIMMPFLDEFADIFKEKVKVCVYDIKDRHKPNKFNIRTFGTRVCYKGGKEIRREEKWLSKDRETNLGFLFMLALEYIYKNAAVSTAKGASPVTEDNFEQLVLDSEKPVVVNFLSSTCPGSKMLGPIFMKTAKKYGAIVDFYYTEDANLKSKYRAWASPTVVVFNDGEARGRHRGASSITVVNEAALIGLAVRF